jgi:hypothetical protein
MGHTITFVVAIQNQIKNTIRLNRHIRKPHKSSEKNVEEKLPKLPRRDDELSKLKDTILF